MPVYEYHCVSCDKRFDAFKKLAQYQERQVHTCGETAQKVLSVPMVAIDYPAYESPATGKWIEGKKAHLEDLKQSGCRLMEPGEQADMQKRVKAEDKALDTFVDNSVDKVFAEIKG